MTSTKTVLVNGTGKTTPVKNLYYQLKSPFPKEMFLRKLIFLDFTTFPKDIWVPIPKDFSLRVRVRDARVVIYIYNILAFSISRSTYFVCTLDIPPLAWLTVLVVLFSIF